MSSPRAIPFVQALLLGGSCIVGSALLGGCSSTPSAVSSASNLQVSFHDFRTNQALKLVNADNPAFANLYSQPRRDATIKLAPPEVMRDLVDFAASEDFFDYAQPLEDGITPDMKEGAVGIIAIDADGKDYGFLFKYGLGHADKDAVVAFTNIQKRIAEVYNDIPALQYIANTSAGGDYFTQEQERIRRENAEQQRKKGGLR